MNRVENWKRFAAKCWSIRGISENGRGSSRSGSIRTGGERDSLPLAGNKEKANLSRSRYVEEVTIAL